MGYNDNSTDFYVDATLTTRGRELIARNDGSFSVVRYRFGDDEIDYRNWNELTGSVNKDQKILDTPILEASANEGICLRCPLITIRNSSLQYLPQMVANPSAVTLRDRTDSTGGGVDITVSLQSTQAQTIIPAEIVDFNYLVKVDGDLLYVANETPVSTVSYGTSQYVIQPASGRANSSGGTQCVFTLRVMSLNINVFNTLAGRNAARPRNINTVVTVTGQQSGLSVTIPVTIVEFVS